MQPGSCFDETKKRTTQEEGQSNAWLKHGGRGAAARSGRTDAYRSSNPCMVFCLLFFLSPPQPLSSKTGSCQAQTSGRENSHQLLRRAQVVTVQFRQGKPCPT